VPPAPASAARPAPAPGPKPAAPQAAPPQPARGDAFASALAKVRQQKAAEPRYGDPAGDAAGDASEGQPGDRYAALARRALQELYVLPPTIPERDRMHLRATVILLIEPDGKLAAWRFRSRSGNATFDDALERAMRQVRLPPPPAELRREVRAEGLVVNFVP